MAERSGLTLAAAAWGWPSSPWGWPRYDQGRVQGVVGLTGVGHVLTLFAAWCSTSSKLLNLAPWPAGPRRFSTSPASLILELAGTVLLGLMGERDLALWFMLGAVSLRWGSRSPGGAFRAITFSLARSSFTRPSSPRLWQPCLSS